MNVDPLTELCADIHSAAQLGDDPEDHRQAEPAAFTDFLGGEERLEDARQRIAIHSTMPVSVTLNLT